MKQILRKPYVLNRKVPENFSVKDRRHFEEDFQTEIRENHLMIFKNANVLQQFLFYNYILKKNYCFSRKVPFKKEIKSYLKNLFFSKKTIHEGLWVLDQWSIGYYHWLVDTLPRIISAETVNCNYPCVMPEHFKSVNFIVESLEIFKRDVVTYNLNEKLVIKKLIAPSHFDPANCDPMQIKKVRDRFWEYDHHDDIDAPYKKVYISRTKAKRRFVVNEKELQEFLCQNGFITVFMEDLSFTEQRRLMLETKVLLSNHGAGLTNMLFLNEGSTIIELKSDSDDINNCFFNLARALNHKYYYTINHADDKRVQRANINVDINVLGILINDIKYL